VEILPLKIKPQLIRIAGNKPPVCVYFMRCLQLRFDFDSTGVRRTFDCLPKGIKCTVRYHGQTSC